MMTEIDKNNLENARDRAALEDDPNYKRFVSAYEKNAEAIRNMSDYEYKCFLENLKQARIPKMPWYKRAWYAVTHDVDAAMMTLLMLGTVGTTVGAVVGSKLAKANVQSDLDYKKKQLETDYTYKKKGEAIEEFLNGVNDQVLEYEGPIALPLSNDLWRKQMVAMDMDLYNQMAADANINIDELRKITGSTASPGIPSTDIYPKMYEGD